MDALVMGRVLVDLYANELNTPLSQVRTFSRYLGGSAGNMAVGLARLGIRAGLISGVGQDAFGDFLLQQLAAEGVDTSMVRKIDGGHHTALAFADIFPPDRFGLLFYRHQCADVQVRIDHIDAAALQKAPYFITNLTALSRSPSRETALWALETHQAAGRTNLLDLDWRPTLWDDERHARAYLHAALRLTDIAIANEEELEMAGGFADVDEAAERVLSLGPRLLVAKRGRNGVICYERGKGEVARCVPFRVEPLNLLGAGDGFAAGFVAGLVRGWPLERCLQVGNAVGAIVVTRHSCSEAIPHWPEVEEFLARHDLSTR